MVPRTLSFHKPGDQSELEKAGVRRPMFAEQSLPSFAFTGKDERRKEPPCADDTPVAPTDLCRITLPNSKGTVKIFLLNPVDEFFSNDDIKLPIFVEVRDLRRPPSPGK